MLALESVVRVEGAQTKTWPAAAVPGFIQALHDKDENIRCQAANNLMFVRPAEAARPAVPALLAAARDKDPRLRDRALEPLSLIDPGDREVAAALVAALKDPNPEVQVHAAAAINNVARARRCDLRKFVPELIAAFKGRDTRMIGSLAETFGNMGPAAKDAIPSLIGVVMDGSDAVRPRVLEALGKIGPLDPAVIPVLVRTLEDPDRRVRWRAATALATIGPGARPAVPALIRALEDKDKAVRAFAAEALGQIGTREALAALKKYRETR